MRRTVRCRRRAHGFWWVLSNLKRAEVEQTSRLNSTTDSINAALVTGSSVGIMAKRKVTRRQVLVGAAATATNASMGLPFAVGQATSALSPVFATIVDALPGQHAAYLEALPLWDGVGDDVRHLAFSSRAADQDRYFSHPGVSAMRKAGGPLFSSLRKGMNTPVRTVGDCEVQERCIAVHAELAKPAFHEAYLKGPGWVRTMDRVCMRAGPDPATRMAAVEAYLRANS
jgi:hypothetical protein